MNCTDARQWLAVHRDGELDLARDAEVSAHLQTCASCAAAAQGRDEWKRAVRDAAPRFAPSPAFADRLRGQIRNQEPLQFENRKNKTSRKIGGIFNVLLPVAAALVIGYMVGQRRAGSSLLNQEILANHTFALINADRLTEVASSDRHTVKPWLSQHLEFSPPVADLASDGFPLAGGRVDRLGDQPVAALVYHRRNHIITVFVWPADAQALPKNFAQHGYQSITWQQGDWDYVAIADLSAQDLNDFAERLKTATR